MNGWLLAGLLLLPLGVGPGVWAACRHSAVQRLAGANLATTMTAVLLLFLARGFGRTAYVDLALVLAVLGPAGTLVFTRLLAPDDATNPDGAERGGGS